MTQPKMMSCFCRKCQEIFTIPSRRGRPPHFCDNCLGANKADSEGSEEVSEAVRVRTEWQKAEERRIAGEARAKALDDRLRLFGRHISQHRHKWES